MSLPGDNYACKPYIDDGSPLPAIGERVRCFGDEETMEGVVTATDAWARTVTFEGRHHLPRGYPVTEVSSAGNIATRMSGNLIIENKTMTLPWQNLRKD